MNSNSNNPAALSLKLALTNLVFVWNRDPLTDEFDLLDEKLTNGDSNCAYNKKKRRSVHEKFLEDNSEYYGFQVLTSKLRSSGEPISTSNSSSSSSSVFPNNDSSSVSIWRQFLHEAKVGTEWGCHVPLLPPQPHIAALSFPQGKLSCGKGHSSNWLLGWYAEFLLRIVLQF